MWLTPYPPPQSSLLTCRSSPTPPLCRDAIKKGGLPFYGGNLLLPGFGIGESLSEPGGLFFGPNSGGLFSG